MVEVELTRTRPRMQLQISITLAVSTDTSYETLNNLVRDYMNFGAWLTPFKHQTEQGNFFEFNKRFEIIAHMPQFAVVRLEPRQGGQEFSAMLSNLLGANKIKYLIRLYGNLRLTHQKL